MSSTKTRTKKNETQNKRISVKGYFVYFDDYDRAKLMFLDDYNDEPRSINTPDFTKSYICNRSRRSRGNNPLDGNYFFIKCDNVKEGMGIVDGKRAMIPLQDLLQHTVECIVWINTYKFKKDGKVIQGWNLNLDMIRVIEP